MATTGPNTMPEVDMPQFKNAQAVEEPETSPISPTFDASAPRGPANEQSPEFKYDMFGLERPDGIQEAPPSAPAQSDRRMSKEWDASKVPPSRFQKRAGSIHATPASRDGHVDRNDRNALFEQLTKGNKGERRKSQS
ncbi:hypothetical protein DRE_01868 [Drechslerella stenobrocha 248]|uniref:Uncharacterized protein n=1 Tax=Drechslerella stenobrocha 248 TaxID=1043628 RepID=W7HWW1_9PEZI|nr:hypothetical protein DRE_01868 [Drechslerella stenobrocha 248]